MFAYLTASTEWVKNNKKMFGRLLKILTSLGYTNTNEYFTSLLDNTPNPDKNKKNLHIRTRERIKKADLLITDISDPSVTIGMLIEYAISNNIQVLCLCQNKHKKDIPSIIRYYDSRLFTLLLYDDGDFEKLLRNYLENFTKEKVKFNAFISLELDSYMKWYSTKYRISKSDFVRDLILSKMKTDREYQKTLSGNN